MDQLGSVVIAAGYGSVRPVNGLSRFPKILEMVGGKPMVVRAIEAVRGAGLDFCVVVVNPVSSRLIANYCEKAGIADLHFVVQQGRTGTADAVSLSIPRLEGRGITDFVVTYADMPLWTPETVARLARAHCESCAVISKVTVRRTRSYPELNRYGRVIRDGRRRIARVVEINRATREELRVRTVNPSLWAWNCGWFRNHVHLVEPVAKGDGMQAERHLPPLVGIAYREGELITEVRLANPAEALGVNTEAELRRARAVAEEVFTGRADLPVSLGE